MFLENTYLSHYGIKGQVWGVRRFQNEDGSLTEAGKDRYGVGSEGSIKKVSLFEKIDYRHEEKQNRSVLKKIEKEKKRGKKESNRRLELKDEYRNKGLDERDAEIEAYRKEKAEKMIKTAAVVTVAALAIYGGYKAKQYISSQKDIKITSGSIIQRITATPTENANQAGFVAFDTGDKAKYKGLYGKQLKDAGYSNGGFGLRGERKVYSVETEALRDIKVAGERESAKVYRKLMREDPEFRRDTATLEALWKKSGGFAGNAKRSEYGKFNTMLVGKPTPEGIRLRSKFYSKLQDMGYDGVLDINDKKYSGYHTKKPTILFDMSEGVGNRKVRELDPAEIEKGYSKVAPKILGLSLVDMTAKKSRKIAIGAAMLASIKYVGSNNRDSKLLPNKITRQRQIIDNYKKEHPNTQMTDREILNMVMK